MVQGRGGVVGSGPVRCALMVAPGASADRDHPSLVAMETALAPIGIPVRRIDLPSRRTEAVVLGIVRDQARDLATAEGLDGNRVAVGGRSYGGRMCSLAVAAGLDALALVLVSYPLHPPGRPEKLRTAHFPRLQLPCLFVSGTRDAFGSRSEMEEATAAIPGPVEHHWIEGGGHGLRSHDADVARIVARWLTDQGGLRG